MASSNHHVERKLTHELYNVKNGHGLIYNMINLYNFPQDPIGENDYNFWLKISVRFKCKLTEVWTPPNYLNLISNLPFLLFWMKEKENVWFEMLVQYCKMNFFFSLLVGVETNGNITEENPIQLLFTQFNIDKVLSQGASLLGAEEKQYETEPLSM